MVDIQRTRASAAQSELNTLRDAVCCAMKSREGVQQSTTVMVLQCEPLEESGGKQMQNVQQCAMAAVNAKSGPQRRISKSRRRSTSSFKSSHSSISAGPPLLPLMAQ